MPETLPPNNPDSPLEDRLALYDERLTRLGADSGLVPVIGEAALVGADGNEDYNDTGEIAAEVDERLRMIDGEIERLRKISPKVAKYVDRLVEWRDKAMRYELGQGEEGMDADKVEAYREASEQAVHSDLDGFTAESERQQLLANLNVRETLLRAKYEAEHPAEAQEKVLSQKEVELSEVDASIAEVRANPNVDKHIGRLLAAQDRLDRLAAKPAKDERDENQLAALDDLIADILDQQLPTLLDPSKLAKLREDVDARRRLRKEIRGLYTAKHLESSDAPEEHQIDDNAKYDGSETEDIEHLRMLAEFDLLADNLHEIAGAYNDNPEVGTLVDEIITLTKDRRDELKDRLEAQKITPERYNESVLQAARSIHRRILRLGKIVSAKDTEKITNIAMHRVRLYDRMYEKGE